VSNETLSLSKFALFKPARWKKSWRQKTLKKKAKGIIRSAIPDDPHFVECFIKTSPTLQSALTGAGTITVGELEDEARALHEALGSSEIVKVLSGRGEPTEESKYENVFSFTPALRVQDEEGGRIDKDRSVVCFPSVPPAGWVPTFYQFQRQDLLTILTHYAQHGAGKHSSDHICRSLILSTAMANFYLRHGQSEYKPNETTPDGLRNQPTDSTDRRLAAMDRLPVPGTKEVDIATISFAVGFHDSGRQGDGLDKWEHESGRNAYYYMRQLGYSIDYAADVARIIVKNEETAGGRPQVIVASRTDVNRDVGSEVGEGSGARNAVRNDPAPLPEDRPFSINDMITHDADTLEIQRVLLTRYPPQDFDASRFHFLSKTDFDDGLDAQIDRQGARAAIIQDSKDLAQLTVYAQTEQRKAERDLVLPRFTSYIRSDQDGIFLEFEQYLIDAIFADDSKYPFLYEYYFQKCFDPADTELARLSSEERLAVIRSRLHAVERKSRDDHWAKAAFTAWKGKGPDYTHYDLDAMTAHVNASHMTMNLPYNLWRGIIEGSADQEDPRYKQWWEYYWYQGLSRSGAGADETARDGAEHWKLNYQTAWTDPAFRDMCSQRPKYAAVNGGKVKLGACAKYGSTAIYVHDKLRKRATYTYRDTFAPEVMPDHVACPDGPLAVFRQIKGVSGFDPQILKLFGHGCGCDTSQAAAGVFRAGGTGAWLMYLEAQIHGPISWKDDVLAIVIEVTKNAGELKKAKADWADEQIQKEIADVDTMIEQFAQTHDIHVAYTAAKGDGMDKLYATRAQAQAAADGNPPDVERPDLEQWYTPAPQPVVQQPPPRPASPKPTRPDVKPKPKPRPKPKPKPQPKPQPEPEPEPQPEPEPEPEKSSQVPACRICGCTNFKENPWRPGLCANCQHRH